MSKVFADTYAAIKNVIEFNPSWKNSTGYLDHACNKEFALPVGKCAKTVDDFGRKVILIGTPLGNVVVFSRFSKDETIIVSNWPNGCSSLQIAYGTGSSLNEDTLHRVLGWGNNQLNNVGKTMLGMKELFEGKYARDEEEANA